MESSTIDYIDNTSNLNNYILINRIVELIVADVKAIPEYQKLQRSMDLVLRICLLIENLVFEIAIGAILNQQARHDAITDVLITDLNLL